MKRWRLSKAAQEDLVDMHAHGLATFGERQAEQYLADIERTFELLAIFPQMAREQTEFAVPIRVHHHGSHYISYMAAQNQILIVRVVHDDADLDRLFHILGQ
jgi:toxin ParE1/3/4